MKEVTLGELVRYVLENRRGNAFRGYSELEIASGIKLASDNGTLLYAVDKDGTLCGVITAEDKTNENEMFIQDFLATESWVFPQFLIQFKEQWPNHTLAAKRYGRIITYNTDKLMNKILKGDK